jgi:hypothetical protein
MAINETITLQGVPQVKDQLAQVTAASQQTSAAINSIGAEGAGIQNVFVQLPQTAKGFDDAAKSAGNLRIATASLKPALADVGVAMGPLREFSRLAAENIGFLGVAAGTSFLVSIQKAADEIGNLQRQLQLLVGQEGAKTAFDELKKSADDLHTSVNSLAPALQAIITAQQRVSSFRSISGTGADISITRGLPTDPQKAIDAITALNKAMQAIDGNAATAAAAVNSFFQAVTKFDPKTKTAVGLTLDEFIKLQDQAPAIADALQKAFGPGLFERLQDGPIKLAEVLNRLSQIKVNFDNVKPPDTLVASIDEIKTAWDNLLVTLANVGAFGQITQFFRDVAGLIDDVTQKVNLLVSAFQTLQSIGQQAIQSGISGGIGSGLEFPPLASGGLIRGPGTSTSDSILARVSAGEFVLNAAATRHWGVQMLSALNNMRMPSLLPASTLIPRFAEGGPVTAPTNVHLHFGGESFALQASEGVANALRKHAVRSQLVSTGRKPSWY